ncbi:MAG: hypothetical protein HQL17_05540 [Candidatus Omnitrophica bacterium]|nr:hypothetical protein [Candidatus Omnitrophota bacterium]
MMPKDTKVLLRLLAVLFLSAIIAECGTVFILSHFLRGVPFFAQKVLGGAVMVMVAGSVLYVFVFRNLVGEAAARAKAEEGLRLALDRERRLMASVTLTAVEHDKKLAAAVARAAEEVKRLVAAAELSSIEHDKGLASALELAEAQRKKGLVAAEEKLASEHKKNADKVHELDRKIAASEGSLKMAYQRIAESEEELRMVKAGLELRIKEGVRELLDQKVKERTRKLEEAKEALELAVEAGSRALQEEKAGIVRMRQLMDDREMRVIEAKREVNRLSKELGRAEPYLGGRA